MIGQTLLLSKPGHSVVMCKEVVPEGQVLAKLQCLPFTRIEMVQWKFLHHGVGQRPKHFTTCYTQVSLMFIAEANKSLNHSRHCS